MTRLTPRRMLIAGWLVFLLYAYPGYMKGDAADQLVDSRIGEFTDWHSSMMTELWRIVGRLISGPAGMLFLQSLLLVVGAYHLLRRAMSDRNAAIAAVCVLMFPPLLATTALISAEAQLAGFLVAGAAAMSSERPRIRFVGLGLMAIACGMTEGAPLAALPIIFATSRWAAASRWRRRVIAVAVWLAVVVVAWGADRLFVDSRTERNDVWLASSDIIGTLHFASTMTDAELQPLLAGTPLASSTELQPRARAVHREPATDFRLFDPPATDAQRDALVVARHALARAAPAGYLHHRWDVFYRVVLGISRSGARSPLYTEFVPSPNMREALRHAATHSMVQSALISPVRWLSTTLLFAPHLYFFLAIVLLPIAIVRKERTALVLLASGVLYELTLFVVASRAEYRDSHWMIAATVLAVILLVARGWESRSKMRKQRVDDHAAVAVAHDHHV